MPAVFNPQQESVQARMETVAKYSQELLDRAQQYTNFLIAGGFGAFFIVWASFHTLLPRWAILLSGAMMGIALLLFIGFNILQAWLTGVAQKRLLDTLAKATAADFDQRWAAAAKINSREARQLLRIWPVMFVGSVAFGVGAAILLVFFGLFGSVGMLTAPATPKPCVVAAVPSTRASAATGHGAAASATAPTSASMHSRP